MYNFVQRVNDIISQTFNIQYLHLFELAVIRTLVIRTPGYSNPWLFEPVVIRTRGYSNPWLFEPVVIRTRGYSNPWLFEPVVIRTTFLFPLRLRICASLLNNKWYASVLSIMCGLENFFIVPSYSRGGGGGAAATEKVYRCVQGRRGLNWLISAYVLYGCSRRGHNL